MRRRHDVEETAGGHLVCTLPRCPAPFPPFAAATPSRGSQPEERRVGADVDRGAEEHDAQPRDVFNRERLARTSRQLASHESAVHQVERHG